MSEGDAEHGELIDAATLPGVPVNDCATEPWSYWTDEGAGASAARDGPAASIPATARVSADPTRDTGSPAGPEPIRQTFPVTNRSMRLLP